jgi:hypothetical protein
MRRLESDEALLEFILLAYPPLELEKPKSHADQLTGHASWVGFEVSVYYPLREVS